MLKRLQKFFFLISLSIFLLPMKGFSTHIVGGELNYKYLGNNKYEVRITVYRDCLHGVPPFDDPLCLGIFDSANHLVNYPYTFTGYFPADAPVYYTNAPFNNDTAGYLIYPTDSETVPNVINNPCVIPPVNICYRVCHYIDTLTLPFIPGGYQLVYQICCRNQSIININNSTTVGDTFIADIPDSSVVINNGNPVFTNLPPTFICLGIPFTFNHSATDPDGDSMVYHICTPFGFAPINTTEPQPPYDPPYIPVNWAAGYSLNNLLSGVPLAIDSLTGILTCTPATLGLFVYGVCVSEYRNGVYLDMTRRDYQINVVNCQLVTVASIESPLTECGNDMALFQNNSTGQITGYHWNFGVTGLTNDTSDITSPTYTYPDTGAFSVELIAYSSYSNACNDTTFGTVYILAPFLAGFRDSINMCTNTVAFTDTSATTPDGPPNLWHWDFGDGNTSTVQNPTHTYSRAGGTDTVTLIVRSSRGCIDTIKEAITLPMLVTTSFTDTVVCSNNCDGIAQVTTLGGTSPYTYVWSTVPAQTNSAAHGLCPGIYYVTTTDVHGCTTVDSVLVLNAIGTDSIFVHATPDTIFSFQTTQLSVTPSSGYTYTWSPSTGLSNTAIYNPTASPTQTTTYYVALVDANGCRAMSDSIQVVVLTLHCNAEDIYVPNAFTPDGNGHNDVLYVRSRGITNLYFAIYNRWGQKVFETSDITKGWDGTYNGSKCDPDVFVYYLNATCLTGLTYFKKGNISLLK